MQAKAERKQPSSSAGKNKDVERSGHPGSLAGAKRPREDDSPVDIEAMDVDVVADEPERPERAPSGPPPAVADLFKEEATPAPSPLPSFKKRKAPAIKKHKPEPGGSSTTQASSAKARPKDSKPLVALEAPGVDDGLAHLLKPTKTETKVEVNLMDKDVYASLFAKNAGTSAPRSGVNLKEKEERRKQLDKMREEDRARRATAAEHVFDLRAQHDKVMAFVDRLQSRRSSAMWPNILAVAFRHEKEREDRRREREKERLKAEQERETGEVLEDTAP
ncbi:hypothetical protein BV25DRAFT_1825686 [Artomyces pyxidatus]|uniref:Uncharacterized protein n=1 Tax=Artomyces pyxidatus TaxID=48021 RepID=A0ACB8T299_9AGAM|nr:hypothetical protein BV25DRAFT_1825686 [Artomyces pyxidatus]